MTPGWLGASWIGEAALAFAAAALAVLAAAFVLARLDPGAARRRRTLLAGADAPVVFLFDDETLLDATDQARRILGAAPEAESEWHRLRMLLLPRFPDLDQRLAAPEAGGEIAITSLDGVTRLVAEWRSGVLRLTLADAETGEAAPGIDRQSLNALERELEALRASMEHAPFLVWRQTPRGQVTWVNRAYLDMLARAKGEEDAGTWPPPALFAPAELMQAVDAGGGRRLSLAVPSWTNPLWFDCTSRPIGAETLFMGRDVTMQVRAETQLREFRQTLTKTFAHLTIGLAIFDRTRHLALFNPALADLTRLPIDFLAARPTLNAFLDRLREKAMMPEPKDYKSWRKQLVELEAAAASGTYAETWSLPAGQTYRVTGRPHPDGAVAFLFEDISAEISLTRRFRSELELGQAVIDSLDEAIAVFSPGAVLELSNAAYARLWGTDPATSLSDIGLAEATETWRARSAPSPVWEAIGEFAARGGEREAWSADLRLSDGRGIVARIAPLAGGATLVGFRLADRPDRGRVARSEAAGRIAAGRP